MSVATAKGQATRQRIIEGAAAEVREHGVSETTLDDLRARSHTSKSQLFHYFPGGKDEILLAVADFEAQQVLADQQPYLGELDSWDSWQNWRDALVERYRNQGPKCPLNTVMSQVGRNTPGGQAVVAQLLERWQDDIATGIRRMQRQGEIAGTVDADQSAAAVMAGIQGGVVIMLAAGSMQHLEAALDLAIAGLRRA